MEDKNYATLRHALDKLPGYQPPETIWDALENQLDTDTNSTPGLITLPQYDPAPEIWKNIEAGLERDQEAKNVRSTWKVFNSWKSLAAAATVVLAIASTVFFRQYFSPEETIAIQEEQVDDIIIKALHEPENPAFEMVQSLCLEQKPVCQQPEFQQLKSELDELTAAKTALKNALGNYGNDPGLVVEMVKIERERSKLLEQIVSLI